MQAYNALYYTLKEITQLQIGNDFEILSIVMFQIQMIVEYSQWS